MIVTTLILGTASGLEWVNPEGSETIDPFTANVTNLETAQTVNFTLSDGPDPDNKTGSINGDYASTEFNPGDTSSGDYTLTARGYNSTGDIVDTISKSILVDSTEPSVEKTDDKEYVNSDDTVRFDISDDYTDVTDFDIQSSDSGSDILDESLNDNPVCPSGESCTKSFTLDTGSVSAPDTITLTATVEDGVGNSDDPSFSYTFDNSYDGDTPSFSVEGEDDYDGSNIRMDESDDKDITITMDELDDGEPTDIRINCYDGDDDRFDQTGLENVNSDDFEFTCEIPADDYAGSTEDIYVEACDEAGNCESSDTKTYSFDSSDPFVSSFETEESYSVFNSDFDVAYEAGDEASGVEYMEYMLDGSTMRGDGTEVEQNDDGSFTVDTSTLSQGEHTVYFRVRDGVDRWSGVQTADFEFYPNELPEVSVSAPGSFNVTAGQTRNLQVGVENTGKLFVKNVNVSVSDAEFAGSQEQLKNLASGDSATLNFEISPSKSDVGEHTLTVETDNPSDSTEVGLLVKANPSQQEKVESQISNFTSRLQGLESNISDLRSSGLSDDLNRSLESNTSEFITSIRNAESYVEQGDYYRALNELESISEEYENAKNSYSDVERQHEINQRNQIIKISAALAFILAIVGGVYIARNEDLEIDLSEYGVQVPDFHGVNETVSNKFEGLKEFIEKEEEEAEKAFQGFS